ncbi:DUF2125 domain-containing protein [Palleronia caenipelagi]|uniref:DUF2125 domain-containing protein n=1 Tax=Palleronia caenipelagi TaxID=2489174 RepID=A0A547Q8C2_9RHOB|nr:DUF2125 domain-containing protein [Palleronia caenipelagi]TRD22613.1 DUF2125 domain-containing protein [Palleronia caenipelagi]
MRHAAKIAFATALLGSWNAPVQAEITPEALWGEWQAGTGEITALAGEISDAGEGFLVQNAVLKVGRGAGAPTLALTELSLAAEGEATRLDLPATAQANAAGETYELTLTEMSVLVSGEMTDPDYVVSGQRMGIATDSLPLASGATAAQVQLDNLMLSYLGQSGSAEATELALIIDPVGETPGVALTRQGVTAVFEGDPEAFAVPGSGPYSIVLTTESGTQDMQIERPDRPGMAVALNSGPTRDEIRSDAQDIILRQSYAGLQARFSGPAVPLPDASMTIGATTIGAQVPALSRDAAQPFSLDMALTDVEVSEQLWQLFDPAAALPRDPVQLSFALSGDAVMNGETPRPERLTLDDLRLSLLGAEMSAKGGVQFAATPSTERVFGRPVGGFGVTLTGFNALIQNLMALGTIPQQQLFGLQMGLSMFTTEGEGPDTLTSRIEMGPDGTFSLNGQPMGRVP